jgi:hypothetical protein
MPIKDAAFWVGLASFETSLFLIWDGKHMVASIALCVFGIFLMALSVYTHYRQGVRVPLWIGVLALNQAAICYDYYDRHHASPSQPMFWLTVTVFALLGCFLYLGIRAAHAYKITRISRRWQAYAEVVSRNLPLASDLETYASLVTVLRNNLGNMCFEAYKKHETPLELERPLSNDVFTVPTKECRGYPVDIYLFRRAFLFLRDRLPALEEKLPETPSQRTSSEIQQILEETSGALKAKADELRAQCYDKLPT